MSTLCCPKTKMVTQLSMKFAKIQMSVSMCYKNYCSKWETRYRTIRSSLRSIWVYKIKVGWRRRITVKIRGLIRSSSCSISLFSSKDWLLRLKLSYLNDSCNKTLMTKTLESARNISRWFLNLSKASSIKTSNPLNKSKVRAFMIFLNLWTHK